MSDGHVCCMTIGAIDTIAAIVAIDNDQSLAKEIKGAWRMPWLTEAMKDVISCDKPGLGANDL